VNTPLERGREALRERRWGEAYALLAAADQDHGLGPADLEPFAMAAFLIGKDTDSIALLTRAHHAYLERGDQVAAARAAFWISFESISHGNLAVAGGWTARASRLLEGCQECAERGYLLLPAALARIAERDIAGAHAIFREAAAVGERVGDRSLTMLARQGAGRSLIDMGERDRGFAMLDEVMVGIAAGDLVPAVTGTVFCSVLDACVDAFDMRRAQEWSAEFSRWCASQPDLVPYRGRCLVRRSEMLTLRGRWAEAFEEAARACARLAEPPVERAPLAAAHYQIGEIHRLRGELDEADEAYRRASDTGRQPQPGLSLLRLRQHRPDVAAAGMRRTLDEARDPRMRLRVLGPAVEVLLAGGESGAAYEASQELAGAAARLKSPFLEAIAATAHARLRLAQDDPRDAVGSARQAFTIWRELDVPYEAARARVLIGLACRELGDVEGGSMELDAAAGAFDRLGAAPDLALLAGLPTPAPAPEDSGLSPREVQVLRLVASGRSNRDIASQLDISEKTVARHLSNIFDKLDVGNRSAAAAYAFRHGLMG
jgi:DNA-binding CsgD family transcriptional regulator